MIPLTLFEMFNETLLILLYNNIILIILFMETDNTVFIK